MSRSDSSLVNSSSPTDEEDQAAFFAESLEQSRVKARIVAEFFFAWVQIVTPTAQRKAGRRIEYIDLYAGPGRYADGTKSTPLLILERAIADPTMRRMLRVILNDAEPALSASLESTIKQLLGIETLTYQPKVFSMRVGPWTAKLFERRELVPTFTFLDPFGYKGLSLPLIRSLVKDWGCDCVFFFNFNRINMGLSNAAVEDHMEAIFGERRLGDLRAQLATADPAHRGTAIMNALADGLRELGGKYVVPFCFRRDDGRVSHYLIFVTKNVKGYEVMTGIMAKHSSSERDGVPSFEYDPRGPNTQGEFFFASPIDDLGRLLMARYRGQRLTVRQVFERHSLESPRYLMRNYQEALRRLETASQVQMDPPADKRRKGTLATHVTVIF